MARPRSILVLLLIALAAGTLAAEANGNPNAAPPKVDMSTWRLDLTGGGLGEARAWTYEELLGLPMIKKREQLVCPGLFAYYAVWEGVPLSSLLEAVKVAGDYSKVTFIALDGYSVSFTREEVENNLLFLAVRVYDKVLPPAEGFPLRLVAEGFSGGKWVRWLKQIRVQ